MRAFRLGAAAIVTALLALAVPGAAQSQVPTIFTVDTTADGNDGECSADCTLREAVALAADNSSIMVPPGVYRLTLGPLVPRTVGIQGAGARTTIIDARGSSRVAEIRSGTSTFMSGLTIRGGSAPTGGGAHVAADAALLLSAAVVDGNAADGRGGGIVTAGTLSLVDSTVSGNRAGAGGGIAVEPSGDAVVITSTLSGNRAVGLGGGIVTAGTVVAQSATIAGNSAPSGGGIFQESTETAATTVWNTILAGAGSGGACGGALAGRFAWSGNLADDGTCALTAAEGIQGDPRLGPLTNNGGPTDTRALGAGSPAINAGDQERCPGNDQRDAPAVGDCDIGAFEFGGRPPALPLDPPVAGETVNASRSRGTVRVRLPGSDEFFVLQDGQQVPVGSTFDTRKGRVTLEAAGENQRAWFYRGMFRFRQSKGARPLTTLSLTEPLSCGRGDASAAQKRKRKRRLWGDGRGRFRTKGRFSSATVRGTKWLTEDRCSTTLTRVVKGRVAVRDRAKRRTVIVRAGKRYIARKR